MGLRRFRNDDRQTSSDRYVPMTPQDELARIDGQTLAVTSIPVGLKPKVVATIPGSDGAVVLDTHNGTATVVRPAVSSEGDTKRTLGTLVNLNRVDIDPSGRYAVVWFARTGNRLNQGSLEWAVVVFGTVIGNRRLGRPRELATTRLTPQSGPSSFSGQ